MIRIAICLSLFVLSGCESKAPTQLDAAAIEAAAAMKPTDERIAGLYAQSCKTCHTVPGSMAPLTGNRSQWDERWKKGLPALMQSVVVGLNGMPPGGQCFACTPADYETLIEFLAGRE